jgi:hypothetical protein
VAKSRSHRWLIAFVAAALLFGAASTALSLLAHTSRAHRLFTARLAQAFGRDVEVSYYDWRWLPSPGIVAHYVTIGEDPRFGQEYFLRAQSVAASPRWRALFSGRIELGALELMDPSLNLVRNTDGSWNVESWLPRAPRSTPTLYGPHAPGPATQLTRIEIQRGRINFNRGTDRHPFALADLEGSIEQESPGRWRIELEARPLRATVHLQDTGIIRVSGFIAGTSARLHPAELDVTWSEASLADVLRLALGRDPGVRGNFQMELKAQTAPVAEGAPPSAPMWGFSLSANVAGPHRWDISARQSDPSLSVRAEAQWQAGASEVVLSKLLFEGPHSSVSGTGSVDWKHEIFPDLKLESSGVAVADLLDWYRAFRPGVADGLTADGFLQTNVELLDWPFRVKTAKVDCPQSSVKLGGKQIFEISGLMGSANWLGGGIGASVWLSPDPAPTGFAIRTSGKNAIAVPRQGIFVEAVLMNKPNTMNTPGSRGEWRYGIQVNAALDRIENLLQAANAIGQPMNKNWDAEGGLDAKLGWVWESGEHFPKPTGQVTLRDVALRLPLLNQPVEIGETKIELSKLERRITVKKVLALGAHWQGTVTRRENAGTVARNSAAVKSGFTGWDFDLTADHLDAVELDQWLGPRARPGWLARLLSPQDPQAKDSSSGNSAALGARVGPLAELHARGNLRVGSFHLAPLEVERLRADVELQGRTVNFSRFDAQICSGAISGGLLLNLDADPSYWLHLSATNMNAAELGALSPALQSRLAGQLSGEVRVSMHGIGRESLLASLKGAGTLSAKGATIQGFYLSEGIQSAAESGADPAPTDSQFSLVNAEYSVSSRKINFERITLLDSKEPFEGRGTADFGGGLEMEFWPRPIAATVERMVGDSSTRRYRVNGTLEAPRVAMEAVPQGTVHTLPQKGPQQGPQQGPHHNPQPGPPPARH